MLEKLQTRLKDLKAQLELSAAQHNANVGSGQMLDHLKTSITEQALQDTSAVLEFIDQLKVKMTEEAAASIANHNTLFGQYKEVESLIEEARKDCCEDKEEKKEDEPA